MEIPKILENRIKQKVKEKVEKLVYEKGNQIRETKIPVSLVREKMEPLLLNDKNGNKVIKFFDLHEAIGNALIDAVEEKYRDDLVKEIIDEMLN